MTKKTVGAISAELATQKQEKLSIKEQQEAMTEDYLKNLIECVDTHAKIFLGNFYVVVITKNEKLMPNVFRNYFSGRESCPTPDYDQTVFRYNKATEDIEYIWTIPSRDACHHLKDNALLVHPEEKELLKMVLAFADGTLYKICKQLNGEEIDSNMIANKEKIHVV